MFTGSGEGSSGSTDEKKRCRGGGKPQGGSSQEKELWGGRVPEGSEGPTPRISFVASAPGSPKLHRAASRTGPCQGRGTLGPLFPVRTPQVQGLPGALPERGLTVWAAVAALLARRGGRAMGEGGPVPTPLRGAPAPIPGEA